MYKKRLKEAFRAPKKSFSIGGSGASLTKRENYDFEMGEQYRLKLKIPPVRVEREITTKEFKGLLKAKKTKRVTVRLDEEPITKEEFKQLLKSKQYLTRRQRRTAKERRIAALEYFEHIEEQWWVQQQMTLLYHFDKQEEEQNNKCFKDWFNLYAPKVAKAIKFLQAQKHATEAKELQDYFEKLIETNRPKQRVLTGVVYQLRKLALTGDVMSERNYQKDLKILADALKATEAAT